MDHYLPMWRPADISFDMIDDLTADPVVTVVVTTPDGTLRVMAEPEMGAGVLILRRLHIQDGVPNAIGAGNLLVLARTLMERMDFDGLLIEGALRTTGANPGHRPAALRFTRAVRAAAAAGPD
jgi:hypothetical protein